MNGTDFIKFAIDTLKADPNYADVDMSESSAFYNLVILPFSVLAKPVFDLNASNLAALKLDTMTTNQMDDYSTLFFAKRRTENLMTLEVSIYLNNVATPTEPLLVYTSDQFRTSQNQVFSPIQDYVFAYNTLPFDPTNTYRVATIIVSSTENYNQILENTIKTSSLLHPLLSFVTNTKASSSPISAETNSEFIKTIQKAISQRNNLTSDALYTNLKAAFPQITDCLSIGYGDPEMQRDIAVAGKAWSGHFGGMTDIYVRTPLTPVTATIFANENSTHDGYSFVIRKYKGYDWNATDTASPNPLSLSPWIEIDSNGALPTMPVVLIDWDNTSISNTTLTHDTNGLIKYKIEVLPDPIEKSYGKNYRYSPYENIKITIYTDSTPGEGQTVTLKYYTLSNIEEIQSFINASANRVLCSNNLVKSFIPIEIKELKITYDSRYTVNEEQWKTTIANIINNWSLSEPIRLTTLLKDFPAPTRIDEIWYDSNASNLPYEIDQNGVVIGYGSGSTDHPCYATMLLNNIDGSYNYYLSTRQIYPLTSNGLSTTYRTCRYFINPNYISFVKGSW